MDHFDVVFEYVADQPYENPFARSKPDNADQDAGTG
jgi:hypothetical protein